MKDPLQVARYAGQDAERGASNPFAPGTPEYDAWSFGYSETEAPRAITFLIPLVISFFVIGLTRLLT